MRRRGQVGAIVRGRRRRRRGGRGEGTSLLRRESAEPAWDADLPRRGLPRPARAAGATWRGSSASCGRGWAARVRRICGCRSGIRAGTGCTPTSRSAATYRARRSSGLGVAASSTSSSSVTSRSGRGRLRRRGWRPATSPSTCARAIEDERRLPGLHRYEVAQGFQPDRVLCEARTEAEVIERASEPMGAAPATVWRSSSVEGWHGPPACWAQWD